MADSRWPAWLRAPDASPPPSAPADAARTAHADKDEGFARYGPFGGGSASESLFGEILDWLLAPLLILLPISVAITYLVAQNLAGRPFDDKLHDDLRALAAQVSFDGGRVRLNLPPAARSVLQADGTDRVIYQVLGLRGEWIGGERGLPLPFEYEPRRPDVVQFRDDEWAGESLRVAYVWLRNPAQPQGPLVLVQLAETLAKREQLAADIIKGVIFPQFSILPLSVILVYLGLVRGLRPLATLQARIRARRPEDLSPIPAYAAPEELRPLVVAINDLLDKQRRALAAQKRFIADAAHQMKTPLAGLRTQAELAMRQTDPEELRASLKQIAISSQRAAHVINQLLALARTEHQGRMARRDWQPLDLGKIARELVQEAVPRALERRIDLGFDAPALVPAIEGNATLIRELVANLLDNALLYTPDGGRVTLTVASAPAEGALLLGVEDSGPGIAPAERELVFEPFYRVLDTAERQPGGSGLGLAIVREIAQLHGAAIDIGDNPRLAGEPDAPPGCLVQVRFAAARLPSGADSVPPRAAA
jgi:two-component system sensor histidine kinase TctE